MSHPALRHRDDSHALSGSFALETGKVLLVQVSAALAGLGGRKRAAAPRDERQTHMQGQAVEQAYSRNGSRFDLDLGLRGV